MKVETNPHCPTSPLTTCHNPCKSSLNGPTCTNSVVDGGFVDPKVISPLSNSHSLPLVSQVNITSLIAILFSLGGPSAVSRFIVTFIVYAINRVLPTGSFAHVFDEFPELQPAFAYGDTSTSVSGIGGVLGVVTPTYHTNPRGVCEIVVSAVPSAAGDNSLHFEATAREASTANETSSLYGLGRTTIAQTIPVCLSGGFWGSNGRNQPTSKSFTLKIFDLVHSALLNVGTVIRAWQESVLILFGSYPSHACKSIHKSGVLSIYMPKEGLVEFGGQQ